MAKATIAFRDGVTELFELLEVEYSHYQLLFSETSWDDVDQGHATNMNHCDFLVSSKLLKRNLMGLVYQKARE